MGRRIPIIYTQLEVYINGGQSALGLAEVTLPDLESMTETISGAGIMGEIEATLLGQFSAQTMTINFRVLYGEPLTYAVGMTHRFDLRTALEYEDASTHEDGFATERWSVVGKIKKISPGKRKGTADASIDVAIRSIEHYVDGALVMAFDPMNYVYTVGGVDVYAPVRNAIM